MLRLADHLRVCAQALVPEPGGRDADAVDVACGQADGAREAHVEGIQVRALAAEIAALEHRGDIADAATARFWIAERIVDDPLIDTPRLLQVGERPTHDPFGRRFHDAVGRHQLGRSGIKLPLRDRDRLYAALFREIDRAIACRDSADEFDLRSRLGVRPFDVQHLGAVLGIALEGRRFRIRRPFVAERLRPLRLGDGRQRQPCLRLSARGDDLNPRGDLEFAPRSWLRGERRVGKSGARQPSGNHQRGGVAQEFSS